MARGADRYISQASVPLHMPDRRQKLIVRDHASADDQDRLFVAHASATTAANASSRTPTLSRKASSLMTSGGQILIVPPPKPTGVNKSTPFSIERSMTFQARSPSGS